MFSTLIIIIAAGVCVASLVGAIALQLNSRGATEAEDRLSQFATKLRGTKSLEEQSLLDQFIGDSGSAAEKFLSRFGNFQLYVEQAGVNIPASKLLMMVGSLALAGSVICIVLPVPKWTLPVFALSLGCLPALWLYFKRARRLAKFGLQLPEAMEFLSRSLRAGHSLGAGFGLVASEMQDPIAKEFGRTFEEQNFGITLEESLQMMVERVPNLDLRFFATAVTLQRQTGGDLAEIMDKIGKLIRERIKLAGAIQALTGEGRLSGIVLLALPPSLFVVMFFLNRDYAMVLFNDETGRKLLAGALVMQLVGALVIRKIINVKV